MKNHLLTLFLITVTITALFSQESSFKKFKEEKTNTITAYSGGFPFPSNISNFENPFSPKNKKPEKTYKQEETDLRPTFKNGKYYLFLKKCPFYLGYGNGYGEAKNGYFKLFLYIKTDQGDVFKVSSTKKAPFDFGYSQEDFKEFKFFLTKEQLLKIYNSKSIEIDFSPTERNDFENFAYTFDFVDLTGCRDFVEGMAWVTK